MEINESVSLCHVLNANEINLSSECGGHGRPVFMTRKQTSTTASTVPMRRTLFPRDPYWSVRTGPEPCRRALRLDGTKPAHEHKLIEVLEKTGHCCATPALDPCRQKPLIGKLVRVSHPAMRLAYSPASAVDAISLLDFQQRTGRNVLYTQGRPSLFLFCSFGSKKKVLNTNNTCFVGCCVFCFADRARSSGPTGSVTSGPGRMGSGTDT